MVTYDYLYQEGVNEETSVAQMYTLKMRKMVKVNCGSMAKDIHSDTLNDQISVKTISLGLDLEDIPGRMSRIGGNTL
jgi:hypothetical protein